MALFIYESDGSSLISKDQSAMAEEGEAPPSRPFPMN